MNWKNGLEECEALLRAGQTDLAAKKVLGLAGLTPPPELRGRLATIAGDAGLSSLGLRLITDHLPSASADDLFRYARLLAQAGAIREAISHLNRLPDTADVRVAKAEAFFDIFREKEAEEELRHALHIDPSHREARVRLAQIQIRQRRFAEAGREIDDLIQERSDARILILRVEWLIGSGEYKQAQESLAQAASHASAHPFTLHKWRRILFAFASQDVAPLDALRQDCIAEKDGEGLRLCDLFALRIHFTVDRFQRLYFGTPSPEFRERLKAEFPQGTALSEYVFGAPLASQLDLATGHLAGETISDLPPRLIHSILVALTRDLYRPVSAGAIFMDVFPQESFDVHTSVHRVHQAIHRTRRWLAAHQIPVAIHEFKGRYSLTIDGFFAIRIPLEQSASDNEFRRFSALAKVFGDRGFTARQARQALGLSPAVFKSLMCWAQETGHVTRLGAGPATKYKINAA